MTMDRSTRVERSLRALFEDVAQARTPDYLEAAIERASSRPQRPAWTFLERWLPMEIATTRVPVTRMPWRQLGVLVLIAFLVAAILAVYIGSAQQRLPAPFGPAANGVIALGRQGDLFIVDPRSGRETLILGGPPRDEWIGFTPDGTHGLFVRWGPDNGGMTAARVGSIALRGDRQAVFVDKDVIHQGDWIEPAPDSLGVAFTAYEFGTPNYQINLAALDGSTYRTFHDVPLTDYGGLAFLAPEGRELVYLARSANGQTHDIRALDVESGKTRAIVETGLGADVFGNVSAAPDGKRIAYALRSAAGEIKVHVVGIDGRDDTVVGHAPGATFEAWPQWDPQGRRLLIERDSGDGLVRPVIVDLAGGPEVVVDTTISANGAGKQWAPDGSSILSQRTAADGRQLQQEFWDTRTGTVTQVSWPSETSPAWQRLAP
jgi:hypothetical protein